MNFIDPQLRPILDKNQIIEPDSGNHGGGGIESIGNGRYAMTLPDGTKSSWTSTATSSAEQTPS